MDLRDLLDILDLDYLGTWISTCRLVLDLDPDGDLDADPYLAITKLVQVCFVAFRNSCPVVLSNCKPRPSSYTEKVPAAASRFWISWTKQIPRNYCFELVTYSKDPN